MAERFDVQPRPHGLEARVTTTPSVTRASSPCGRLERATPLVRLVLCLLLTLPATARAQRVELTSPLDGHARPGRAAAVHVTADGLTGPALTISGDGVIPVQIPATAGRVDATVPLLAAGDVLAELRWSDGRVSGAVAFVTRPLAADDRLIAVAGAEPDAADLAAELFTGRRPVVVRLDTADPRLLRPPQAFDAADAVLLDLSAAARVGESQLRVLLAAGTIVAVRSPGRPQGDWPWRQAGVWWVLQHEVAGPRGGVSADAYAPTFAWDRAWPADLRRNSLLAAILFAMLLVGAALLRGRRGLVAALGVCAAAAGAAAWFARSLAPVVTAAGEVVVTGGGFAQRDRWTYASALRDAPASVDAAGVTRPVLGTRRQLDGLGLSLLCDAGGSPVRYEFALPAKQTIAFVSRTVGPAAEAVSAGGEPRKSADAPIGLLADRLYPGEAAGEVAGQVAGRPAGMSAREWWGTVVMRR